MSGDERGLKEPSDIIHCILLLLSLSPPVQSIATSAPEELKLGSGRNTRGKARRSAAGDVMKLTQDSRAGSCPSVNNHLTSRSCIFFFFFLDYKQRARKEKIRVMNTGWKSTSLKSSVLRKL